MFVEFFKANKSNKDMCDLSKRKLVINAVSDIKRGQAKIEDFDDTDIESKITGEFFRSGCFYTFCYASDNDSVAGVEFGDCLPVVLCCKKRGKFLEGINFNMLPNEHRAVILDILDKASNNFYSQTGPNKSQNGEFVVNEIVGRVLSNDEQKMTLFKTIEEKTGCSIVRAYRRYNTSHMTNPRFVEYGHLKYLPILLFEGSVRGASIKKVQDATISK